MSICDSIHTHTHTPKTLELHGPKNWRIPTWQPKIKRLNYKTHSLTQTHLALNRANEYDKRQNEQLTKATNKPGQNDEKRNNICDAKK